MMEMLSYEEVVSNEVSGDPAERLRRLVVRGAVAGQARPGQFLHVRVSSRLEPLLRRPLSIASIDRAAGEVTLRYRVQGKGTEALAEVRPGERLDILGPLGNGFTLPEQGELWLVGGGIGIFPLYALARAALEQALKVRLFWGGETRKSLESAGFADWDRLGIPLHLSTMDGSLGKKGLVTAALLSHLEMGGFAPGATPASSEIGADGHAAQTAPAEKEIPQIPVGSSQTFTRTSGLVPRTSILSTGMSGEIRLAACGPRPMLQAVAELGAGLGLPVEVSLEERMGCGVGACLGCSVATRDGLGRIRNRKVCQDGPVFRGEEVVWDGEH